jgi:hypothetical protein
LVLDSSANAAQDMAGRRFASRSAVLLTLDEAFAVLDELQAVAASLGPAGYLGSFTTYFDHGLLLVEDLNSRAVHDEWDSATSLVNLRPDSLCLRTRIYVDGPVVVFIFKGSPSISQGYRIFDGVVEHPSKALRIEDSDATVRIRFQVDRVSSHISLVVDDMIFVGCAAIVVRE